MGGRRVLVVDDDRLIRMLIQASIKSLDCEVREAVDGEDALNAVEEFCPDVIVLDVVMPKLDGFAVLERLRLSADGPGYRILMLTTAVAAADHEQARSHGADAYIEKPFDHGELRELVAELLSQGAAG
ncbi:MAG: response regulator [Coriobacteriia bacterium]|nr:response regulator [Coriobacteriia bacterium]